LSTEKNLKKSHHKQSQTPTINEGFHKINYEPKHISETFYGGNPNTLPMDRHFLWKDFRRNQFQRPFWHGVVGPQWRIPIAEDLGRYRTITSPMPKGNYDERVVPFDLPPITHSHSSWDMPKRQDVVQIDLPYGSTHTREMYIDARFPPKKEVGIVTGSQYHNTGSVDPEVNHGNNMIATAANHQTVNSEFSLLEKNYKKRSNLRSKKTKTNTKNKTHLKAKTNSRMPVGGKPLNDPEVNKIRKTSISEAGQAELKAAKMLDMMTPHPEGNNGSMILGIDLLNKRDLAFELHKRNLALDKVVNYWKHRPQGIRVMHTKPFLPYKAEKDY